MISERSPLATPYTPQAAAERGSKLLSLYKRPPDRRNSAGCLILRPKDAHSARGVYSLVICLAALPTDIRHSPTVWITDGLGSYIADCNNSGMAATTIGSYPAQVCSDITPPTMNDGHVKSVRLAALLATNSSGFFYNLTMRGQ